MFRVIGLLSLLSVAALAGDAQDTHDLADANTEFALDMYKKIGAETGNIIFSPYSISTALAMASSGAEGETLTEMYKALKYSKLKESDVFDMSQKLIKVLNSNDNMYNMSVANKLYGEKDFTFKQPFLDQLRDSFDTTLDKIDFKKNPESARETINEWVEDVTNDKIKELLKEGAVTQETVLYIVNAIYFGAIWQYQFKKENNMADEDFHVSGNKIEKVTYMTHSGKGNEHGYADLAYLNLDAKILELPYTDHKVSMYIILPNTNDGLSALESKLEAEAFLNSNNDNVFSTVRSGVIANVRIPKFEMRLPILPKKMLSEMGMTQAFTSRADFSRIGDAPLTISDVAHQAFINVHEAGTEAAAVTSVGISLTSLPSTTVNFYADHPFLYLIREKTTGTILFMGRYVAPPAAGGEIPKVGEVNYQVTDDSSLAGRMTVGPLSLIFLVFVGLGLKK